MFETLRRWLTRRAPSGQCCATCRHFEDHRDTEADWANGYCGHPAHSEPMSAHHAYGGHWTNDAAWCRLWTKDS